MQEQRLGQTEASDNPCGSTRIKSSLTRPTVRWRKPKGNRKGSTTVRAGPKRRKRSQEGKSVTSTSAGLL